MAFFIGQKVVCISDDWEHTTDPSRKPEVVKGGVYVIRGVHDYGYPSLTFEGLRCFYHQGAFRPIVEKKTDIAIFTAMLTPKKVKADA